MCCWPCLQSKKGKKGKVKIPKKGLPALASEGGTTTDVGSSQEGFSAARSAQAAGSVDGVLGEAASQARPVAAPKEGLGARLIASLRSANATGTSTAPTSLGPASPSITSSPKEARGLKSSRSKRQVSGVLASSDYDASGTLDKANDGLVGSSNVRGVDTAQEADTDDDDAPKSLRKPSAVQRFLGSLRQQPSAVQPSASSTSSRRPSTEKGAGAGDEVQRSGHSSLSSTQRSQAGE